MTRASLLLTAAVAVGAFASLTGCRGQTSKESPIVGIRGMYDQPRYDVQSKVDFFPDHRSMRLPVRTRSPARRSSIRRSPRGGYWMTAATS